MRSTKHSFRSFVVSLGAIWALTGCAEQKTQVQADFAFVNIDVLNVETGEVSRDQTVAIRNGRISHIGDSGDVMLAQDTERVEGQDKFLAPGLTDMHVHFMHEQQAPMTVTYGVTTVRNMWGYEKDLMADLPDSLALRAKIEAGDIIGPLMITAGQLVDGVPKIWPSSAEVANAEEAVAEVERQMRQPYDFIKVYSHLNAESFDAIAAEANRRGRPFAGHIPEGIPIRHGLAVGMATMEHMIGFDVETALDRSVLGDRRSPERGLVAEQLARGELDAQDLFDWDAMDVLARDVANSDTWIVPTLIVTKKIVLTRPEAMREFERDQMRYVTPDIRAFWNPENDFRRQSTPDERFVGFQKLAALHGRRVKSLHDAGARLLIGSDVPNPFVFDGLSVHEEMALFVEAGLTPLDAIRAATLFPAAFFGQSGEWGEVSVGARADLVMLDADPFQNIENYQTISGVMLRGQYFDQGALARMRADVAEVYRREREELEALPESVREIRATGFPLHNH